MSSLYKFWSRGGLSSSTPGSSTTTTNGEPNSTQRSCTTTNGEPNSTQRSSTTTGFFTTQNPCKTTNNKSSSTTTTKGESSSCNTTNYSNKSASNNYNTPPKPPVYKDIPPRAPVNRDSGKPSTFSKLQGWVTDELKSFQEDYKAKAIVKKSLMERLVYHPSHLSHGLDKVNHKTTFKCDGCKVRGVGERYECATTLCLGYNLHVDCFSSTSTITFQGYNCQLLLRPPQSRSCGACGMMVEGFVYHCEEMDVYFHPLCVKLTSEIIDDVVFTLIKHGSSTCLRCEKKQHILEASDLRKQLSAFYDKQSESNTKDIVSKKKEEVEGWSYVSSHKGYTIHVHCLMEMVMEFYSTHKAFVKNNGISVSRKLDTPWLKALKGFLEAVLPKLIGTQPSIFVASVGVSELKYFVNLLV